MMQEARPMPANTSEDNRRPVSGGRLDVREYNVGGGGGGGEEVDVVVAVQEEDNDAEGQADACEYE